MDKVGAVLVVGAGIGGSQASLDLAESGYKVYLVESTTSIGGVMAQLDKTFPTNDCAMCIVSPKLVETGRHQNIELIINADIAKLSGKAGNFTVTLKKRALHVKQEVCTGCGVCASKCPIEAIDVFNEGLAECNAISVKFPQAVPRVFVINLEKCIGCGVCEGVCKAGAVEYDQEDSEIEIKVGSIILSPGFDEFVPDKILSLGYGKYKNVVTSIEFERILSASGPFGGKVLRPSDGDIPKKLAFLQCIGSRDYTIDKPYCSSVCCMYTAKEAVIAKEHFDVIEPTIFCMDIRAFGKDFDKYIVRAQEEYGVRYIRSRVSSLKEIPETRDLKIQYETEAGEIKEEVFNMVVLAVGAEPPHSSKELAKVVGVKLNEYGFCQTDTFFPVDTSKPGIFACGMFAEPKDIPETVIEAGAAAGRANLLLAEARNTLVTEKELVPELDVSDEKPRIGVFVCHCGINIGGYLDVPDVVEYAKTLPNVVYAERNLYTCSADTQTTIKAKIEENKLNRVIVASCTPRTHESLFQSTIREVGLNKYLFEMANIRDQCSWVHMREPKLATKKAKDLVRMAAAKARNLVALKAQKMSVTHKAMIIGGGVGGMTAALNLADQGFEVFLVEKNDILGGFANHVYQTLENDDVSKFIGELIENVNSNKLINVYLNAKINSISGYVCNFTTNITHGEKESEFTHGVIILATGANEYEPKEYLYGQDERVITQSTFEKDLFTTEKAKELDSVVMIQCVGSRNEEHPYCSRMCCAEAIKNAIKSLEINPDMKITILYRDIRTYGFKEKYYRIAREKGVLFIRFDEKKPPEVKKEGKNLTVTFNKPDLGEIKINSDLVVLSAGIVALSENKDLAPMLKVPTNDDNFFLEAHVKLRPSEFATDGIFLCGTARGCANISETISQANSAASKAATILSKDYLVTEGPTSQVNPALCIGCNRCAEVCSYGAIGVDFSNNKMISEANPLLCKGCGDCAAECPAGAIKMTLFSDAQIEPMIKEAVFTEETNGDPKIIAFLCNWCSYAGADLAGVSRYQYPPNIRIIRVMCSGRITPRFIYDAFLNGADGVIIGGCHIGDCHYIAGNYDTKKRSAQIKHDIGKLGINPDRFSLEWISASEGKEFSEVMTNFVNKIKEIGPLESEVKS